MMATMHSRMLARAKGVMVLRKRRLLSGLDILMDRLGKISSVAPRFATAANTVGDLRNELARADTDSNGIQLTMNQIGQYVSKLEPICSNCELLDICVARLGSSNDGCTPLC